MSEAQSRAVELLKLRNEEYFTADEELELALQAKLDSLFDDVDASMPPVLAIGAPGAVDPETSPGLPALIATCETGLRRWQVDPAQNLRIVATDLRTGAVAVGLPFVGGKREVQPEPSMSVEPPDDFEAASMLCNVERVDLRRDFDLEVPRSRIAFAAISYDRVSNVVVTDLGGEPWEPTPRDPSPFLETADTAGAGPEPGADGVAFTLPERASAEGRVPVGVAVELPRDEVVLAPAPTAGGDPLLLASLLLLRLDEKETPRVDLAVPVKGDGRAVEARFGFDLRAGLSGRLPVGLHQAWLVVGRRIAGPVPITLEAPAAEEDTEPK